MFHGKVNALIIRIFQRSQTAEDVNAGCCSHLSVHRAASGAASERNRGSFYISVSAPLLTDADSPLLVLAAKWPARFRTKCTRLVLHQKCTIFSNSSNSTSSSPSVHYCVDPDFAKEKNCMHSFLHHETCETVSLTV